MPYYRITITDAFGKVRQGVRYDHLYDIDAFQQKAYRKAVTSLRGNFKSIDVVMLTSNCAEVKQYLEAQRKVIPLGPSTSTYTGKDKYAYRKKDGEEVE